MYHRLCIGRIGKVGSQISYCAQVSHGLCDDGRHWDAYTCVYIGLHVILVLNDYHVRTRAHMLMIV